MLQSPKLLVRDAAMLVIWVGSRKREFSGLSTYSDRAPMGDGKAAAGGDQPNLASTSPPPTTLFLQTHARCPGPSWGTSTERMIGGLIMTHARRRRLSPPKVAPTVACAHPAAQGG